MTETEDDSDSDSDDDEDDVHVTIGDIKTGAPQYGWVISNSCMCLKAVCLYQTISDWFHCFYNFPSDHDMNSY